MAHDRPLLIPRPKLLVVSPEAPPLVATPPDAPTPELATAIDSLGFPVRRHTLADWQAALGPLPSGFDDAQSYALRIASDGVTTAANSEVGHFYARQTLAQALSQANEGRVPAMAVVDWPTFAHRGVHVCYHLVAEFMPESAPNFPALLDLVARCAHYKINLILLEIEAMFPHRRHPSIPCALAFTRDEIGRLRAVCAEYHVEIVPLLQCLGHAYHVLRHPEYAHLRETPNTTQQYCPSNPQSRELYLELVNEIRDAFPDVTYLHMGGDESRRLGICPVCRQTAASEGVGALYGRHVGACAQGLLDIGLRPIIWADMVEHHPDAADHLPADLEFMYWNYNLPDWPRPLALDKFMGAGRRVWAAAAIRHGAGNHTMGRFDISLRGITLLAAEARRCGCDAFVATDWTKAVPHELSWVGRALAADEGWGGGDAWPSFAQRFARVQHGLDDDSFAECYRLLAPFVPYCEDAPQRLRDRLDRFDQSGIPFRERVVRYTALADRDQYVPAMKDALDRAQRAETLARAAVDAARWHRRELGLISLSARTIAHKARLGLAIDAAARLLRYPMPEDAAERERVAGELDELMGEHDRLKEETATLLRESSFAQSLSVTLDLKFELAARGWMARFRDLLRSGRAVPWLLGTDEPPGNPCGV